MQVLASQLHFLANRNAELADPPLSWPVNCIKIGGHVALLSLFPIVCFKSEGITVVYIREEFTFSGDRISQSEFLTTPRWLSLTFLRRVVKIFRKGEGWGQDHFN